MADVTTLITMTPILNGGTPGKPVTVSLIDNANFAPSSSSGGWQVVDRPKSAAATQWFDRSPWQLKFDCYLDKQATTPSALNSAAKGAQGAQGSQGSSTTIATSVEDDCTNLETWLSPVTGTYQPPIITLSGSSIPGNSIKYWILYGLEFTEAVRDFATGNRIQQKIAITLYEYLPPLQSGYEAYGISPAAIFASSVTGASTTIAIPVTTKTYTVKAGDTLSSVATKFKTTSAKIASLNNFNLSVGANFSKVYLNQIILIP